MKHPHRKYRVREALSAEILAEDLKNVWPKCTSFRYKNLAFANDAGDGERDVWAILEIQATSDSKCLDCFYVESVDPQRFETDAFVQWIDFLQDWQRKQKRPVTRVLLKIDHPVTGCIYCRAAQEQR